MGRGLLLAVEILAPVTLTVDEVLKRKLYEDAGVPSYWMFDPTAGEADCARVGEWQLRRAGAGERG